MDRKEEMTRKVQAILENLDSSKREMDSFVSTLPGSIDRRISCALWQERFFSLLYGNKIGNNEISMEDKWKKMIMKGNKKINVGKVLKFLRRFTSLLPHEKSGKFCTGFLFLYSSSVQRDIVHELLSQMRERKSWR
jgi:hypothetical protein